MKPYHKIYTLWKRDPENKHKTLVEGEWKYPIFEFLQHGEWLWYEKVDGTNVRITYHGTGSDNFFADDPEVVFNGRRDLKDKQGNYAPPQFSKNLWADLRSVFDVDWFKDNFDFELCGEDATITLYGEGFGAGIRKGGNYGEATFCLFDVMINDMWMEQDFVDELALQAGLQRAPLAGKGSLVDAIEYTRKGFNSQWGDFEAEGLILRPPMELYTKLGHRVIGKIKCKDFPNG